MKITNIATVALVSAIALASCRETWPMYDTNQKDHLYFEVKTDANVSFSLMEEDAVEYSVPVKMMGMPRPVDRTIPIEYLDALQMDGYVVEKAEEGVDFILESAVMPANEVTGAIKFSLKRTEKMKTAVVNLRFRIVEDEEFLPLAADSSQMSNILTPEFSIRISDGEPLCPKWWDATSGSGSDLRGWTMYAGNFYPEKFRKMLSLYWQIEQKNPVFFEDCINRYGRNLDKEDIAKNFFATENPAAWASYVLIPLCEYYKEYYKNNPEDEHVETIQTASGTAGKYWRDPVALLR